MAYTIKFTLDSERDLDQIFKYYALEFSTETGTRVVQSIMATVKNLESMPDSWGTLNDKVGKKWIRGEIIRMIPSKQYWIFYLIRSDTVHILRIRHSSTNWLNELENLFKLMPK